MSLLSMGSSHSTGISQCLTSAVKDVAFPNQFLFDVTDLHRYNLDIAVHPIAITYPSSSADVSGIVSCATKFNATVQARSGGHSYGSFALGGGFTNTIVVDLKKFQQFSMDNSSWIATFGAGHLLGDVTHKLLSAGNRAMAHGTCPQVGIGGHATIGGLGPASRMWGSALDHVVEVEVVLANSSIVTASAKQNRDVFWGLKGAGASFGIVTEFKVNTHPAPGKAVQFSYTFNARPFKNLADRFIAWQNMIADPALSRKFASQLVLSEVGLIISGTYFGSQEEFAAMNLTSVFPNATSHNTIVFDSFAGLVGHWAEDVALQLGGGIPSAFYSKSLAFTPNDIIPDDGVHAFFQYLDDVQKATPIWFAIFDLEGGATNDVAKDATAYGHRDALFYFQSYGVNIGKLTNTTRAFVEGMNNVLSQSLPGHYLGAYAGYVDPALPNAQEAYWGSNLKRLKSIKAVVDPSNIFSNPQSVPLP